MWHHEAEMMQDLQKEIQQSFEEDDDYGPISLPKHQRSETRDQKEMRLEAVQDWLENHPNWTATKTQKVNIVTTLFYCIWNEKQNPPNTITFDASDKRSNPEPSNIPTLGKIDLHSIIQHMLRKVNQLHLPRYVQFLSQESNLETLLLRYLRREFLDVCEMKKIELSE